jgi:hypothetical protein
MAEDLYAAGTYRKKKRKAGASTGLNAGSLLNAFMAAAQPGIGFSPTPGVTPGATAPPNYTKANIAANAPSGLDAAANIYNMMTGTGAGGAAAAGGGVAGAPGADPWTGFASNYAAGGADLLWNNPEILIRDQMKAMGFGGNDGLMDLMEQYGPMMQYLQMLGLGTGDPNSMTPETLINWTGDWTTQMLTPGAGGGDVWGMISSILDAPKGSALAASLESGTPEQQAANLNNLVRAATAGMPPLFQQALGDILEDKTTDWLSQKARGTGGYRGFLADWLQKGGKGILG